jgi:uncharacterized protein (DUF58 family)
MFQSLFLRKLLHPLCILLFATIVTALCGLVVQPRAFLVMAVLLGIIAVGILWPWVTIRGVRCRMAFDRLRAEEDAPLAIVIQLTNHWPWPVWGFELHGGIPSGARESHDGETPSAWAIVERLPARAVARIVVHRSFPDRGLYPAGPVLLTTRFPFGLWRGSRRVAVREPLIVRPRRIPLPPLPSWLTAAGWDGSSDESPPGHDGDLLGARPFRQGDAIRKIHWAQTLDTTA